MMPEQLDNNQAGERPPMAGFATLRIMLRCVPSRECKTTRCANTNIVVK